MNIKLVAYAAVTATAVGVSIVKCVQIHKEEAAKRADIEKNMHLDLEAIRRATDVVSERMSTMPLSELLNLSNVMDMHNYEIKFQKIAIREEI